MEKYKIYCTKEQTEKAYRLGAPIKEAMSRYNAKNAIMNVENGRETYEDYEIKGIALVKLTFSKRALCIPTAEQMFGWIEEQEGIDVSKIHKAYMWYLLNMFEGNLSRKVATLAAIDEALDYIYENKQKEE